MTSTVHDLDHPVTDGARNRDETPREPSALVLAIAGSAAVATAFGMARYGYGLLLPDIKGDLTLTATALGAIGTLAYVSYLAATALVTLAIGRIGERWTVVAGGACAVAGTLVIAVAGGPAALAAGVAIAGTSCGLVYPPFADAVARLPERVRDRTLATINAGTGWGVAVAAPIAVIAGDAWRLAWVGFALAAVLSTLAAARVLPGAAARPRPSRSGSSRRDPADPDLGADGARRRVGRLRKGTLALLGAAFLVGLGSAGYWTYAVDAARDGGLDRTAARVVLGVAGVASLLGIAAADVASRVGARVTFAGAALLEAAAIATVALVPGSLVAMLAAAVAFGAAYNSLVAITVLWGGRLHPDRPSKGLALAVAGNGAGLLLGPLAGGALADATGLPTALLLAAAVVACATALSPRPAVP